MKGGGKRGEIRDEKGGGGEMEKIRKRKEKEKAIKGKRSEKRETGSKKNNTTFLGIFFK